MVGLLTRFFSPEPVPISTTKKLAARKIRVLPGFRLTLGFTLFYLGLIVLIPLAAVFWKTSTLTWPVFWQTITMPTAMASYRLTFGASFCAALVNVVFGLIVAWVLVRYEFFGKKIVDALVDLPFALPTAVAGITLAALYSQNGWIGQLLTPLGIKVANTQTGIFIALTFIGLPFIVRTVQPILEDLDPELEEAASSLGANRWQIFWRVILPMLAPALLTGFALAFARALGEFGATIMVAGNIQGKTQTISLGIFENATIGQDAQAYHLLAASVVLAFIAVWTSEFFLRRKKPA